MQEPVGKWQEVEGDGGSGAKKGSNLLELFYADPKRCVPFSCPTGPLRIGRSPVPVDTCNLQSFQGEYVMCLSALFPCFVQQVGLYLSNLRFLESPAVADNASSQ